MPSEDEQDNAARPITRATLSLDCEWPTTEQAAEQQEADDLNLNEIREAAKEKGYEEWFYCERYDVIQVAAFRKVNQDNGDVVKVQVYPKTHAVSVCYIHNDEEENNEHTISNDSLLKELLSTNKKSLFVAPNVNSVDTVREILADPLEYGKEFTYTRRDNLKDKWIPVVAPSVKEFCGNCNKTPTQDKSLHVCSKCKTVAYCDRQCQRAHWKLHKRQCVDCRQLDICLRFHHVAVVTGLTTDPDELEEIECLCELFDLLLFEPDGPPCFCRSRYACGSICALSNMLLEIGRQHHDVIGITSQDYGMLRFTGQVEPEENYQASFPPCLYHDEFMDEFESYMQHLEYCIVSLKPHIRSELIQWLFERIRCNEKIIMIDSNELPLTKIQVTFPIHFANMDYSRLVYGEEAEQAICFVHGTFHRSSYEDDDDDDVSAAGTERTAEESDDGEGEDEGGDEQDNDVS